MKTLAIILISFSSFSQDSFRYAQDKQNHLAVSEIMSLFLSLAIASDGHEFNNLKNGLILGGGIAFSVGITKELIDLGRGGSFSGYDLTYDLIGVITGTSITYVGVKISDHFKQRKLNKQLKL